MERSEWTADAVAGFGRTIYEMTPEATRARWAADLLALCVDPADPLTAVERVITIGRKPYRWDWADAHEAFQAVRRETLINERSAEPDHRRGLLLDVAETAAKIIYNTSGASAPFDSHAGWRLAPRLRALVQASEDRELKERVWARLTTERT
jgi:hypothetical protein